MKPLPILALLLALASVARAEPGKSDDPIVAACSRLSSS